MARPPLKPCYTKPTDPKHSGSMTVVTPHILWQGGQSGWNLLADGSGILILLVAGFLVFRTFRERYLLAWIAGWCCYLIYRLTTLNPQYFRSPAAWMTVAQGSFLLAVACFVAAVLHYTNQKQWLLPLAVVAGISMDVTLIHAVWWPNSFLLFVLITILYTSMAVVGAAQLLLFSRGRREIGAWLIAGMLLLLHLDTSASSPHFFAGIDLVIELMLGLGMLLVVLDDSKQRADRLTAVHAITAAVAEAQDHGSMMLTVLEELKDLMRARAAWFRLLDGDSMFFTQQVGLSQPYLQARASVDVSNSYSARVLHHGLPAVLRASQADPEIAATYRAEGFEHVLLLPVKGKNSMVGVMCLGVGRHRSYRPEELRFLAATANQVGIAVENLRLLEQIIRSHRQWISTFDSIEDLILVHDVHYRVLKMNRAMLNRLSHPDGNVILQPCEAVLPRQARPWTGCPYCGEVPSNFAESPDPCFGGYSLVSTSSFTDASSDFVGTIHIIRDTTERRQAEERYHTLFERVQEGVFISTPEGRLLDCNDAFVQMLGYESKQDLVALDLAQTYAFPEQRQNFCELMVQHNHVRNYEVWLRRKDGSVIAALENSFATRDHQGRILRYQGFLLDITEKKRAEDEIRQRNRELAALNAMAVVANQSFDLQQILNTALQQVVELFGADTGAVYLLDAQEKLLKRQASHGHRSASAHELRIPAEFWERLERSRIEVLTHRHLSELPDLLLRFVHHEGLRSWIWVIMRSKEKVVGVLGISSRSAREFSDSDQNLMVAMGRQLATTVEKVELYAETLRAYDHLQEAQEQLLQSEKMSAIGQLISGVAHELNNPLTAILGYAQLLENEALSERSRDFVQKLFKQTQRTQRLVQNLLSFARQRKPQKTQVDIQEVVEETLALRDYDMRLNNIEVVREYESAASTVVADGHQLEQVFLNIINNAVDAVLQEARGGRLEVRIHLAEGQVCCEFHDSGPGIREPHRVFDPFYTTKGVGKGTGLGLSICYGIVKEHGGEIEAFNHAEGGAVFRVRLPASSEAEFHRVFPAPQHESVILHGRVLLLDDEEAVLEYEREVLSRAGAEVISCSDAEQAIARLQSEEFDAVLIDCTMPGRWSGPELYNWLLQNRPATARNVVFTLSAASDPETRSFFERHRVPWIVKPFQTTELLLATFRVLQKSRSHAVR